ncbi:MAG: phytoene/squalene synthase family protein [Planctomycetota bacterium]
MRAASGFQNGDRHHFNGARDAIRRCREITRARAKSFYAGLKLTPEPKRSALFAYYAWSRLGDDLADGPLDPPVKLAALNALRAHTAEAMTGSVPDAPAAQRPVWVALAATLPNHTVQPEWLDHLIDGLIQDVVDPGCRTKACLDRYCYRVAGTVGLTCVSVWGLVDGTDVGRAHELAVERGRAFQLTNIARDLREDLADTPSRCYVPDAWLGRLSVAGFSAWQDPDRCAAVVRTLVDEAAASYERSRELEDLIVPECRPVLRGMSSVYERLLGVIAERPERTVLGPRPRLDRITKGRLALSALASSVLGGRD